MDFFRFREEFIKYKVFSLQEIEKYYPDFNRVNLVNWQKKDYIRKLRNRWYRFTEIPASEPLKFVIANRIYAPSYIGFETALAWHGIIPEAVFILHSATTLKTAHFKNPDGNFVYSSLRDDLYFAYEMINIEGFTIRISNLEKTLLDWIYMQSGDEFEGKIEGLRLNKNLLKEKLNSERLDDYLQIFSSKAMNKKVSILKEHIYA